MPLELLDAVKKDPTQAARSSWCGSRCHRLIRKGASVSGVRHSRGEGGGGAVCSPGCSWRTAEVFAKTPFLQPYQPMSREDEAELIRRSGGRPIGRRGMRSS